jgi:hypothetical protein
MISKEFLRQQYLSGKSMKDIALDLDCSLNQVKYWMGKHKIQARTISEAIYLKNNPDGDPFTFKKPATPELERLMGLGLGLYWGEGTKSNKHSVRLGNTDPNLVRHFILFINKIYAVHRNDLRFGLQLFNDINPEEALNFWAKHLKVDKKQFQKVIVTPSRGHGTYRKKVKYGVLTVYYHNKKLRDILCGELKKMGFCD